MPPKARSQTAPPPPAVLAPAGDEGDLPEGWASPRITDIITDFQPGFASGEKDVEGGVSHLRMNNIGVDGELILDVVRTVPNDLAKPRHDLQSDDVLVCTTNSGKLVGKCAVFTLDGRFAFSNHLTRLRPIPGVVEGSFLRWALWLAWQRGEYESLCKHWVNQSTLPKEALLNTEIPLPPLAEQRRIVGVLEGLLGKVAASRERLARVPQLLKRFRQSVLAAACSGKLTADWREENPGVEFAEDGVTRFASTAETQRTRRGVPESVPVTDVVAAWELPESWTVRSAADLLRIGAFIDLKDGNHGANHPKVSEFTKTGLPFITAAQVNGFGIDYAGAYKVSGEPLNRLRVGFAKAGDVIYTHKGSVGRVAVADRDCILTPQTTYYRVAQQLFNNKFVMYFLASHALAEQVASVKEQTTRDFVPISEQYLLFHMIPPLAEQHEIVRRVEQLFALADRLEAQLDAARKRVDRLTQSILAQAFRGELVPAEADLARREGRTYEPASQLLARIREQQTAAAGAPAKPRKPRKSAADK